MNSAGHTPASVTSEKEILIVGSHASVAVAFPAVEGDVSLPQSTVILAGQEITGGAVSVNEIVCTQETIGLQPSFANQVRVMVNSSIHPPAVAASEKVMVGVPSQLSDAVAIPPVLAGAVLVLHWMVTLAGHVRMVGAALSSTTMI